MVELKKDLHDFMEVIQREYLEYRQLTDLNVLNVEDAENVDESTSHKIDSDNAI